MTNKPVPFFEILKTLILFAISFAVIVFVATTINKLFVYKEQAPIQNSTSTPTIAIRPQVSCPADFLSYSALSSNSERTVKLVDERKNIYAENGDFKNSQVIITKIENDKSKVACGYMFVRAGTETYGSLQSWENIYVNPNEFGGHIDSTNHFGAGDGSEFSEYLFSLSDIKYWKTRADRSKNNVSEADWAVLLNVSPIVTFTIALNTNDSTAFIDELLIAYKCWDPTTGEENSGCSLNIDKKSEDTGVVR